jgi:hypothetical protein
VGKPDPDMDLRLRLFGALGHLESRRFFGENSRRLHAIANKPLGSRVAEAATGGVDAENEGRPGEDGQPESETIAGLETARSVPVRK